MAKCFLDIDIGDPEAHAAAQLSYEATVRFFEENTGQLGQPADAAINSIEADTRELVADAFRSRSASVGQDEPRQEPPPPFCVGRIIIELCKEAPKAAENFRCLCTGERGIGKKSKRPLHYQGIPFHRIVRGFVCQGGDVVKHDGSSGDSIYGGSFKPEKAALKLRHDAAGVVSLASSNVSQFFITLVPAPRCDGKHVVLGRVVEGLDILARIDIEAASADGTPRVPVSISGCGEC